MNTQVNINFKKNIQEYYFINSAYLSELWAFQNLQNMYLNKRFSDEETYQQMLDEERHARMLRNILIQHDFQPEDGVQFAMQEVLYKKVCNIDYSIFESDLSEYTSMHTVMEKRAIWNYKTFLISSKNEEFKKVIKKIINDEKSHLRKVNRSESLLKLELMDKWLFRVYLYKKYNKMNLLDCIQFWEKYYSKDNNVYC